MGNKVATFTEEQLEDYQDCTFFTRKEILRIFKRFREMGDPGVVPRSMTPQQASTIRIPLSCLTRIPELKENPFRQRMSEVFAKRRNTGQSSTTDVEGICFEEFLEMMSVFSEQAPRDLKVFYAFKIYGTDHHVNQTGGRIVRELRGRPRSTYSRSTGRETSTRMEY
ncbi:calcium and integrin-binding family member 3 isoform X2 [Hylaeus anthracinus]|uniref:calcium and integrin-binding family member 3 isoform X2 n=1 Tax=Hylaeus volcanicus TaxID=313075 RepID=UPI0023B8492F|nr:calcium and integrin-binding family member 3 isoform X2 [Hylaeus volcanicus]XP_054006102.1 calcium and integrin-binding family member 3 isoform X2 [Hylaeus anthracinus]